jgi:hypothetical protein
MRGLLSVSLPRPLAAAGRRRPGWLRPCTTVLARFAGLAVLLFGLLAGGWVAPVQAQGVDLNGLRVVRRDTDLALEYSARLTLSPALEEALQRGVPMYFVAQATLFRGRWYWRDERLARVSRTWRVAFQPLTASWRVSLGGLSQQFASLSEALAPLSSVSGWHLVDLDRLEPGARQYIEFSFRLDDKQLPLPMQINVGSDYQLGIERTLRVE